MSTQVWSCVVCFANHATPHGRGPKAAGVGAAKRRNPMAAVVREANDESPGSLGDRVFGRKLGRKKEADSRRSRPAWCGVLHIVNWEGNYTLDTNTFIVVNRGAKTLARSFIPSSSTKDMDPYCHP